MSGSNSKAGNGMGLDSSHRHPSRTDQGLAGALVRVLRASDTHLLGTGLSDGRGEALVAVARDIPAITWQEVAGQLVMTSQVAVSVQAFVLMLRPVLFPIPLS
jgi:hypothetical protein